MVNRKAQKILNEFNNIRGGNFSPTIELYLTPDVYKTRLELAIDKKDKKIVQSNKLALQRFNGTMTHGKTIQDPMKIIIDEKYVSNFISQGAYDWIGTIYHESTHAVDLYNFLKEINPVPLSKFYDNDLYDAYYYWTEFNARKAGFSETRKHTYANQPRHMQKLNASEEFKMAVKKMALYLGSDSELYELMQFLGRYSVLCDLYPDKFINLSEEESFQLFGDKHYIVRDCEEKSVNN